MRAGSSTSPARSSPGAPRTRGSSLTTPRRHASTPRGASVAVLIAWFSILFTRRFPPGLFEFVTGAQRWNARVAGYTLLMTEEYPPFGLR